MSLITGSERTIDTAQSALQGLWAHQQLIADNLANVDTPGYSAGRFDFDSFMKDALSGEPAHPISAYQHNLPGASHRTDGNSVDIDSEMVLLSSNSLRYQGVLSQLGRKMTLLNTVIRDS